MSSCPCPLRIGAARSSGVRSSRARAIPKHWSVLRVSTGCKQAHLAAFEAVDGAARARDGLAADDSDLDRSSAVDPRAPLDQTAVLKYVA